VRKNKPRERHSHISFGWSQLQLN